MEPSRIGSSINNLSYFDCNIYPHWKSRIEFFLKMKGKPLWNSLEFGWGPPLKLGDLLENLIPNKN